MKTPDQQTTDTTEAKHTEQDVQKMIEKTAYPDINKANTKTIVIISLVMVILVLLLSILVPEPITSDITTEQSTENTTSTSEETSSSTETTEETDPESIPTLLDMSEIKTSVTQEVFSMPEIPVAVPGFQEISGTTYYLQEGETLSGDFPNGV